VNKKAGTDKADAGEPLTAKAEPRQERAKFTYAAIVDAAEAILDTQGVAEITTRKVAARAGVSVGAVYQYFANREAILLALSKRIMDDASQEASPELFRLHRQSLDELLQALFTRTVRTELRLLALGEEFYRQHARRMQFGRAQGLGRGEQSSDDLIDNMKRLLHQHADSVGEQDTELAAFMIVRGVRMLLATMVEEQAELLHSPALVPMLVRVARAIVDGRKAGKAASDGSAVAHSRPDAVPLRQPGRPASAD
jgi:AcrR family transcriptional regulator